jgi:hypothetical protein
VLFAFLLMIPGGLWNFLHFNMLGRVVYLCMPSFLYIRTNVKSSNYHSFALWMLLRIWCNAKV